MQASDIKIQGAREHNLQEVDVVLPRNQLICLTGVSGSGKSSLAFDTLFAEGQRRYVESLSSFARQFLGQMPKPDVDHISGLSPSISISQKTAGRNPRSTVGTITEVYDFLRVLYARVAKGYCPYCEKPITAQTREQIISHILQLDDGTPISVLAPVIRGQKGEYRDLFDDLLKQGFIRARVDGQVCDLTNPPMLQRNFRHDIEVVVDRLKISEKARPRLGEAVEQALKLGEGSLIVVPAGEKAKDKVYSSDYACTDCQVSFPAPTPQLFSFNSPQGMCPSCNGLGKMFSFDPELLVPNPDKTFMDGAVEVIGNQKKMGRWRRHIYRGVASTLARKHDWDESYMLDTPWKDLCQEAKDALLWGTGDLHITYTWRGGRSPLKYGGTYDGIIPEHKEKYASSRSKPHQRKLERYMNTIHCPQCDGQRLVDQARYMRLHSRHERFTQQPELSLPEVCQLSVNQAVEFFSDLQLDKNSTLVAEDALKEIRARLGFLLNVGLGYLTLDRTAPTLSGGEAQRIRLAAQIGSGLVGVTYILDEPSIGLHARDNDRLINTLLNLRDVGNTVVVVEHDEDTMHAADYIVDFGPGAGIEGGEIVARGKLDDICQQARSVTGQFLSGTREIETPEQRRPQAGKTLKIVGARHNNLKGIDVEFPLANFICVTGVSGSGKSSLINDILADGLRRELNGAESIPGVHMDMLGTEHLDKMIAIDQSPIGRTPRSNPVTYIKVFDDIRKLFVQMPDAKRRGYKAGRFSFNVKGGRCEACEGNGKNKLEMDFLADIWVQCPVCAGKRFNRETLQIRFKDHSISDVLELDVRQAMELFENIPKIYDKLKTLSDVGLDYLKLGQASPTLSGGEAQRIKLARELVRKSTGQTIYVLDEPTTGLHFADIELLLKVLHGFVERGNTVIVVEHNMDVIKTADWVIDLGPDGGEGGGQLVVAGTPEEVAACEESETGSALYRVLHKLPNDQIDLDGDRQVAEEITSIRVRGAKQHNLKLVDADISREKMTVFSGPSGSGKTSLAMDTIYAEGQRRYVESLSSYARQFIGQTQKPRLDYIDGLSPAVAIEQKNLGHTPRSTVGTVTEIYDYLRILMARMGTPHCPDCEIPVGTQTSDQIVDKILAEAEGTRLYLLAPVNRESGQQYSALWDEIRQSGFIRVRVDATTYNLEDIPELDRRVSHEVEVVVDRITVRDKDRSRIAESVESALQIGQGVLNVAYAEKKLEEAQWRIKKHSQHLACEVCGRSFEQLSPHHFSFNSQLGWCNSCEGLGTQRGANPAALLNDTHATLLDGAIALWPDLENKIANAMMESLLVGLQIDAGSRFVDLRAATRRKILHGTGEQWFEVQVPGKGKKAGPRFKFQFKGLYPALAEASRVSPSLRTKLEHLVDEVECSTCGGSRLREDAAAYQLQGTTIDHLCSTPLDQLLDLINGWKLTKRQQTIAGELLREVRERLEFLNEIGLHYLTLHRPSASLSNGEAQRIRLGSQLGSGLCGVLYVLDEPTIGLHPRDNTRLLRALHKLRDLGNTLLVVEHDREIIEGSDYLCDFGPGSGKHGGNIVAQGTPKQLAKQKTSLTGPYLSGAKAIAIPSNRRPVRLKSGQQQALKVIGARHHNLKNVDFEIPLGTLTAVTGPSGSGKSSLVDGILYTALARKLHRAAGIPGAHDRIAGIEYINKVIRVDQNPIGNSPSSNPATYTGLFDLIRTLFSQLPDAKLRGYTSRRFSFNVPGGRCDACDGYGQKCIEMHFLPNVWVKCETCEGKRYNSDTLAVKFRGHSISDVLEMTAAEAVQLFDNIPKIRRILQMLCDVGLDYVALGQPAPTLSGGEAQRVKLAAELSRPDTGQTLYLLDEPTTGLHFDDIAKLLDVLHRLVDLGNTVVVIEHNLDLIKTADWVVDMGPEAGFAGGQIVQIGTPEDLSAYAQQNSASKQVLPSHTGEALIPVIAAGPYQERQGYDPHAEQTTEEDVEISEIGKEISMPWKTDGRAWHVQHRVGRDGGKVQWEGKILADTIDRIESVSTLLNKTDYASRTVVEIAAAKKSLGWFFHAITAETWMLKMKFRTAPGTFNREKLVQAMGLKTLNQMDDLPVYGNEPRVKVKKRSQWQEIEIRAHSFDEIDTPVYWEFLETAVQAFEEFTGGTGKQKIEKSPWKSNGQKWHFSTKGFTPGHKRQWKMEVWEDLYQLMLDVIPDGNFLWNNKVLVHLYLPGGRTPWLTVQTKKADALVLNINCPKGLMTAGRIAEFGNRRDFDSTSAQKDVARIFFNKSEDIYSSDLESYLRSLLAELQEAE